jgi:hypothetical protein
MKHGKQHKFVWLLCRRYQCDLVSLYYDYRNDLTQSLMSEIFQMLKKVKILRPNTNEKTIDKKVERQGYSHFFQTIIPTAMLFLLYIIVLRL